MQTALAVALGFFPAFALSLWVINSLCALPGVAYPPRFAAIFNFPGMIREALPWASWIQSQTRVQSGTFSTKRNLRKQGPIQWRRFLTGVPTRLPARAWS